MIRMVGCKSSVHVEFAFARQACAPVWGLRFEFKGFGFGVWGLDFGESDLGFEVKGRCLQLGGTMMQGSRRGGH